MKLITRNTDYAIRALCCMASNKKDIYTVTELSTNLSMPKPFMRKILQMLNREGLLKSTKGASGGFALTADPKKVTVLDLMEIFQGPFQLTEHTFKGKICPQIKNCRLKGRLDILETELLRKLEGITISSII